MFIVRTSILRKGKEAYRTEEQPVTPASREYVKAISRSLAGMRNGGDGGRLRQDAGPNGGDMRVGDGRIIHTEEKSVADMTADEYLDYINNKNVIEEEVVEEQEEPILLQEEDGPVKDLEQKLLEMTSHTWQAIDKEMRAIAKEYDITPKELHNQFKKAHDGQIPDDWIKENVKVEECGWFPIEEAVLHKNGRPYDVTLIWRGHTRRLKFFWPQPTGATRSDMQRAVELFYPGARLIAYYPTQDEQNNFMVVVPPMTENYQITYEDEWVELPWECVDLVNKIEDVEGKIISVPEISPHGIVSFLISDNETGEHKMVYMGEDSTETDDKPKVKSNANWNKMKEQVRGKYLENKKKMFNKEEYTLSLVESYDHHTNDIVYKAAEYFVTEGLNEDGIEHLIEDIGLDEFVRLVYEIDDNILMEAKFDKMSATTKTGKNIKDLKGGAKAASIRSKTKTRAELRKKMDAESSAKPGFKAFSQKHSTARKQVVSQAKGKQKKGKPVLDRVARGVFKAVDMYKKGAARDKAARKAAGKFVKGVGQGIKTAYDFGKEGVKVAKKLSEEELRESEFRITRQYKKKNKLGQSSIRKSLGRKSSTREGAKKSGYESPAEFREKQKPLNDFKKTFSEGAAWTKSSGKNKEGGLNEKGRKSYEAENPGSDLKAPTKDKGNPRRTSFCARMKGMRKRQKPSNNTGEDRLSKSLKAWDC